MPEGLVMAFNDPDPNEAQLNDMPTVGKNL